MVPHPISEGGRERGGMDAELGPVGRWDVNPVERQPCGPCMPSTYLGAWFEAGEYMRPRWWNKQWNVLGSLRGANKVHNVGFHSCWTDSKGLVSQRVRSSRWPRTRPSLEAGGTLIEITDCQRGVGPEMKRANWSFYPHQNPSSCISIPGDIYRGIGRDRITFYMSIAKRNYP